MDFKLLSKVRCFLIDLDGTLYLGDQLLPGALSFIELLKERDLSFLLLTNNSSCHRKQYGEKLRGLGMDVPDDFIYTSGEATAKVLSRDQSGARVHVVGTPALEEVFIEHGFQLVDTDPDVVVLGFDTTITYKKLWLLCDFVRGGVPYIATHPDLNCPIEGGYMPDIGAMIVFVEASTGRRPDIIVGKPSRIIVEALELKTGSCANELAMVGDRLYTDIALGKHGLTTVLVLSGETHREDLQDSEIQPDYVVENLEELATLVRKTPKVF